ncbi:hypothetical protein L1987_83692 [Smallanthus sonchifolius]|uniref:Uncharacterized protein n=1 Tax=Smallanthus sonchifolius TaxID=185202 RepID=A0ACB8YC06_9ASTR|nr:hypothetical protein L1987_83692 [Smallanthus sonchifolius]
MRSLLGFHPPRFSEEEAWLPAWLQPSTISNQAVECPSLEEIGRLQQSVNTGENGNLLDDGTCKSLHLFLSEEDNSPKNFPSCSSNHEVQYHLHLSSNEESQYSLNPTLSRSQADKSEFNQALLVQEAEAKVIPEEGEAYIVPSQQKGNLGITGPKSPSFKEQKEVNPKVDARCRKADINDTIELAVAASEALIIYKVLKDELIASSVLEAAIRVKQARLENLGSCSIEESNEVDFDFLSDLDYLTMADAYEDVGLTVTSHGNLSGYGSISHVNDSFASENYISSAKQKCNECGDLEVESDSISPKKDKHIKNVKILLKGSGLESFECVTHKEHVDYESENANLACDVDPVFSCSVDQTNFRATEVGLQREGFSIGDVTSSRTILRSNEREDKMTNLVPDRFQSRWFGGWTWKNEVSVPAVPDNKRVPDLRANETSYLSESAPDMNSCMQRQEKDKTVQNEVSVPAVPDNKRVPDLRANETSYLSESAPDMNSCMQRQDKDKTVSQSQSSVAPQPRCAYDDNGADDVAMDPLCSVVPCSFTSDCVVSKHLVQPNLQVNNSESIGRQVVSLKTYSMLYPTPYLDTRGESSSFLHNQTAKVDAGLTSQSSSFLHNQTAKVDTGLTSQREKVDSIVPRRKRVRFSETAISFPQAKKFQKTRLKDPSVARPRDKTLFQDLKFLLTGFSVKKHKQIKILIQKNGGVVFDDIPSPPTSRSSKIPPLILCPKKQLTTKFLYGCAVNAGILKVTWLFDSIDKGLILPHQKYKVLNDHHASDTPVRSIFYDVAIMLHGKPDFCSKMAKVIKHGGGSVFKTFRWLIKSLDSKKVSVGVIVVEDENGISRQLKQCALEQKVPMMPFSWIINSLYAGRLLPSPQLKLPDNLIHVEMSEEI